jgi:hypothetical protein
VTTPGARKSNEASLPEISALNRTRSRIDDSPTYTPGRLPWSAAASLLYGDVKVDGNWNVIADGESALNRHSPARHVSRQPEVELV